MVLSRGGSFDGCPYNNSPTIWDPYSGPLNLGNSHDLLAAGMETSYGVGHAVPLWLRCRTVMQSICFKRQLGLGFQLASILLKLRFQEVSDTELNGPILGGPGPVRNQVLTGVTTVRVPANALGSLLVASPGPPSSGS